MVRTQNPFWVGLGLITIFFHIWLIFSGLVPSLISRPIHMALAIPWVFLFVSKNKGQLYLESILTVIGVFCCFYIALNEPSLSDQYGFIQGWYQFIIGSTLIVITLEMARRTVGWPLPAITLLFLIDII